MEKGVGGGGEAGWKNNKRLHYETRARERACRGGVSENTEPHDVQRESTKRRRLCATSRLTTCLGVPPLGLGGCPAP